MIHTASTGLYRNSANQLAPAMAPSQAIIVAAGAVADYGRALRAPNVVVIGSLTASGKLIKLAELVERVASACAATLDRMPTASASVSRLMIANTIEAIKNRPISQFGGLLRDMVAYTIDIREIADFSDEQLTAMDIASDFVFINYAQPIMKMSLPMDLVVSAIEDQQLEDAVENMPMPA